MELKQVIEILNGNVLTPSANLGRQVKGGVGADLMSDVLSSTQPEAVLLTGLCNPQVVRTAVMADITAIVLVRGKHPPAETLQLAESEGVPIISTRYGMFEACGRLFQAGLPCLERPVNGE
ncbi:MAG: DRTGG domain-containing protein [Thermanaerothrix sp.]|uniref:DRTGG domain-containing protein n=1 Tax=Thermanaerothrix solaris TaxID=3058434 RepID=A0ABU3NMU0_9CHLR|nr:DRTGG domain-containing protein [Thermanaerothrix sp. 4228-RoL]MDT8897483.1 DRTGG domain-containing protein [Thermanaerothrix sp. 4228-RoL]